MSSRKIYVYADWYTLEAPTLMGVLSSDVIRAKEVFSFDYDKDWVSNPEFRLLDPDLRQFTGVQYIYDEKPNFGMFLDSSPDRWGRMLIKRRESINARAEARSIRPLYETDFLLGVYDGNRMGALRFKLNPNGDFIDNNKNFAAPPWASIRELEHASLQFELDDSVDSVDYTKWLRMLIAPGSSLGGARPKANVVSEKGELWIAKFPSRHDTKDMGGWEMVVNELAKLSGINVGETKAQKFNSRHHTFLSKRFDRIGDKRIHFASAMTLLGKSDGTDYSSGASYLSLVEFIITQGADVDKNLEELWRRIVFNIAISNCDDHLRNHGFILEDKGWVLSPIYDINPDEYGTGLKLNISEDDNSLDFELVLSVATYFRLSKTKALEILDEVKIAVSQWQNIATKYGISRAEQEMMKVAFRGDYYK